jgi:hypothetical protein|tara:strand:- start:76 stop:603 length:528 start_codon:yes stop_codon:yes gene_type:complete
MILKIENFLSLKESDRLEKLLKSDQFPWYYQDGVAFKEDNKNKYFFNHNIYNQGRIVSDHWIMGEMLVNKIKKINQGQFKNLTIHRVKCNMFPKAHKKIKSLRHSDMSQKHITAIYYVNTNNGGTIIYDSKNKNHFIPSVKNNLVLFDGAYEHEAVFQTDTKVRLNININLIDQN